MNTANPETLLGTALDGRYELLSVIAKGQGGVLFKGNHKQLDRTVAVKMQMAISCEDESTFLRFQREARSAARLNHPNIITVYDFGLTPSRFPYLVMDFIEGKDLHSILEREGRMTLPRSIRICGQICSALHHAHRRFVVHRDLKPRNVMLMDVEDLVEFVKVVDFGIAKRVDRQEITENLTVEGYVLGTPAYMSPEQWTGKAVDARADIYSLACLLFKMLTGLTPIPGTDMVELMQGHVSGEPMTFEAACPAVQVPQAVQDVVYRALSKDVAQRQSSMAEFRDELHAAFGGSSESSRKWIITPLEGQDVTIVGTVTATDLLREKAVAGDVKSQFDLAIRLENSNSSNPAEALGWLRLAARAGLPEAQCRLGEVLLKGHSALVSNPAEAMVWFRKAAEQGLPQAQFAMAQCYEQGQGVQENLQDAINWYQMAKAKGVSTAEAKLSTCYKKLAAGGRSADGMLVSLQEAAKNGDPEALFSLACFMRSRQYEPVQMRELLRNAVDSGHPKARLLLAELLLRGEGMPRDPAEAIKVLQPAADNRDPEALMLIGACARTGYGCPRDMDKAFQLLQRAMSVNSYAAHCTYACSLLTGDGIVRNIPQGIGILRKASAEDSHMAHWKLALCFRQGLGVPKDVKEMERLFARAADGRFPQGIDWMWQNELFSFTHAIQSFTTLVSTGNRNAMFWMGICAEQGLSVPRSMAKAMEFYTSAADRGHAGAQQEISRIKAGGIAAPA